MWTNKKRYYILKQVFISIFSNHPNLPLTWTHLYGALVVMSYIKEHGMGDGGYQWAETGLNKRSNWLASVTVDQSALFMAVASGHGLCGQGKKLMTGMTTITT